MKLKRQRNKNNLYSGFTIVEVLVALGVFAFAIVLIIGSFLAFNLAQKSVQSAQEVLNELRFSIDAMAKEITFGGNFPNGCENGCVPDVSNKFVFSSKARSDFDLRVISYHLNSGVLIKGEQKTYGPCEILSGGELLPGCYQPFTSDKVRVDLLKFFVNNKDVNLKPIINVAIQGTILPGKREEKSFKMSSSFSPRVITDPFAPPPLENVPPEIYITDPVQGDKTIPGNRYQTSASFVVLGGTASDNVGVTKVTWWNETTGKEGTAVSLSGDFDTWRTPAIDLIPAVINVIRVQVHDAEGNMSFRDSVDKLTVQSIAPPEAPENITAYSCAIPVGQPIIGLGWDYARGADDYHVYRCEGSSCDPRTEIGAPRRADECQLPPPCGLGSRYWWRDSGFGLGDVGDSYTYNLRSHNHTTGLYSDYSDKITRVVKSNPCGPGGPPPPPGESFSLDPTNTMIKVDVDGSAGSKKRTSSIQIRVDDEGGFDDPVTFNVSGLPADSRYFFVPNPLTSARFNLGSVFYAIVKTNTQIGIYNLTITGTGGGKSDIIYITLRVKQEESGEGD